MKSVNVKVSWGPRPETVEELGQRWLDTLGGLTELSGGALSRWRWDEFGPTPSEPIPEHAAGFGAVIDAANPHDDADIIGRSAHVVGEQKDGCYAYLRVTGGGSDEYTPFTASLESFAPDDAAAPPLAELLPEVLALLGSVWDADWGHAYDRALFREVKAATGLPNSAPRGGWAVFLSENRAARIPDGLAARRIPAERGACVLDLAESAGVVPASATVLAAHEALAEAGALEALPVPRPRAKL